MALSSDSKQEEKMKALLWAKFRLQQRFDVIDFKHDVLYPQIEAMKAGKPVLGIEAGSLFSVRVVKEDK